MKFLGHIFVFTIVTLIITGCSGHTMQDYADKHFNNKEEVKVQKQEYVAPTQNKALNSVSPTNQEKKDGAMQKSLDNWLEKEWTPTVEQNETIKKMNEDKNRNFTLQEYVDKAGAYIKNKPKSDEPSMKEKMDTMPVIGTKK
ncbi:hypothetical protein [Sulfurimonas sp. HSL3-2]|uniref:hypothetical protein n=1 Tax=Hydrocurvibacter mobilis TaxID=3131936 RepID=UPI0031F9CD28